MYILFILLYFPVNSFSGGIKYICSDVSLQTFSVAIIYFRHYSVHGCFKNITFKLSGQFPIDGRDKLQTQKNSKDKNVEFLLASALLLFLIFI